MSISTKPKYIKKDPIEHILSRSDMYVGSKKVKKIQEYVLNDEYEIKRKNIDFPPALLRIFIEILSNAIDNVFRSKNGDTPCKKIKVTINEETGETSVWNDGNIIPIEINELEKCYNHTLIFGHLLTGSNYDDEKTRELSGRNGLGGKLCSVFSTKFIVEGVDPVNKKYFKQVWENNMRIVNKPSVKKSSIKSGYTKITWYPDFKQFGIQSYSRDMIELYSRFVVDTSMLTNVNVFLNEQKVPVKNLLQYSKLYSKNCNIINIKTEKYDIVLSSNEGEDDCEFEFVSFVNGVYTRLGGVHVDSCSEEIFRPILKKLNKPNKPQLTIKDVKKFFRLFVVSTVDKPEFDGQDKNRLESPKTTIKIDDRYIKNVLKWSVIQKIKDIILSKEMVNLKKTQSSNRKKYIKIDGLDPANLSNTKKSHECILILCEGLSAKTYAVAGIQKGVFGKKGRDYFGIYALRGKLLNVRNATIKSITQNKIISDIIKVIGLQFNIDYTIEDNWKKLNYGKIMLMTDADVDGLHIESLIINFIHKLFPSILKRENQYIVSMKTPIVRIKNKKQKDVLFYDELRFKEWYKKNKNRNVNIKYYKGLGTTKAEDVPDTFGLKIVKYINDEIVDESMNKVFHKNFSNERKKWISEFDITKSISLDDKGEISNMTISNFIDNEMIKFSISDCKRSIPNIVDGLKESQRKILFSLKKRNLSFNSKSLKVAQLAGYVAEHTNYHHGEGNLYETIIKLANEFPGSNNIPILYRDGMFGTRLSGGKDAASARYIFTKMEELTELIFRKEDDGLLDYISDDGDYIEPKFYVPIVPMILINGCTAGIGSGWSCNIPCYNPIDIINGIKHWIKTKELNNISLKPWYRGFKGDIKKIDSTTFETRGISIRDDNKVNVTELPIGKWTDKFKEELETYIEDKKIKKIKNYSTPKDVKFIVEEYNDKKTDKLLKLTTKLHTSNLVLFDNDEKIKKFENINSILENFCKIRYDYYVKRKHNQISNLQQKLENLKTKQQFINDIITKEIILINIPEDKIYITMEKKQYKKDSHNSYDYLLNLPMKNFSKNKLDELKKNIEDLQKILSKLLSTSEETIWLKELCQLEKTYIEWNEKNN
jgi:DNA topoisomerase-2